MSMVQLYALRRLLRVTSLLIVTLAVGSTAMIASSSPASARSHRHIMRHAHAHYAGRYLAYRHYRHFARRSRWDAGVAHMRAGGFADANASLGNASPGSNESSSGMAASMSYGSSGIVSEARRYLGGNPTGRGSLWC